MPSLSEDLSGRGGESGKADSGERGAWCCVENRWTRLILKVVRQTQSRGPGSAGQHVDWKRASACLRQEKKSQLQVKELDQSSQDHLASKLSLSSSQLWIG